MSRAPDDPGMSSSYEVAARDGQTLDVLTDETSGTRLIVNRLGAAPISLARRNGAGEWMGFLWRDNELTPPAAGWTGHCTVMGYFLHRLLHERTFYRGHEMRGGTHSFLRTKVFPVPRAQVDGGVTSLTYSMTPDQYLPVEYPYKVSLQLTYTLTAGGNWKTTFHFQSNESETDTHVSFGLHPGFALGSLAEAQIDLPAGRYLRHLAPGNFLSGDTIEIDHPGGPMPFVKEHLIDSYLLEPIEVKDPTFRVIDVAGGRHVAVHCAEAPYVTLWSDGHDFICVEPCWGLPDAHQQLPFEHKAGVQRIAPGGALERSFTIASGFATK